MPSVALVTGGGRGLGRAFAIALAKSGSRVAIASRTRSDLDATLALLPAGSHAIRADVTKDEDVQNMIATTEANLGPLDLLVNCAGAGTPFGPAWEAGTGEWWRNIEVNLKGPMLCCHAVIPGMIKRGRGRIINVASGAGTISIPYMSAYVTAKAALIRFTEVLADELRPHGIPVFSIQPGTVRTALAEELMDSEAGHRWLPWFKQIFDNEQDDPTRPGEELILYLASGKADALSGGFFDANQKEHRTQRNVLRLRS